MSRANRIVLWLIGLLLVAGLVWFGCAGLNQDTLVVKHQFAGDRRAVRLQTVETAFNLALEMAGRVSA